MTEAVDGAVTGPARSPRRWLILAAFMVVTAVTQLMWLAYSAIAPGLQTVAGISESKVVLLSTVFPVLYIPLSIPVGRIIDRFGFRFAVLVGAGLTAGGGFVRMISPSFAMLLIGSAIISVGQPFVLNSVTKLNGSWFDEKESSKANGLFTVSLFAGMILALSLTPALFHAFGGTAKRSSLTGLALVYALLATAALVFFALVAREHPAGAAEPEPEEEVAVWASIRGLLRTPGFGALVVLMCSGLGALIAFLQLVEVLLQSKGISDTTAGAMGSLFVLAAAGGSFAISALSDRLGGRVRLLAVTLVLSAVGLLLMTVAHGSLALGAAGVLAAVVLAATWPLSLTLSEELTGPAAAGMAASLLLLVGNLAGAVWTFVMEQLHQAAGKSGSFTTAAVFLAVVCVLGIVPVLRIRSVPAALAPAD